MKNESGFSLIETCLALTVLLVVALGLLPLGVIATTTTENQGHLMARTTEYAQDKMEQLIALTYGDSTTDTRVFPADDLNGSGLTVGGSADPDAPVDLYVDYLDINGNLLAAAPGVEPPGWFYKRAWQVDQAAAQLKRITVTTTVATSVGGFGRVPRTSLSALKTNPF